MIYLHINRSFLQYAVLGVLSRMKDAYGEWNPPPLIPECAEDRIRVNDGRHRLEMYGQCRVNKCGSRKKSMV